VRLFSHSLMMADAVRLMLLGVKLFKAGHAAPSCFEVGLMATVECSPFNWLDGLVIQVSKYNAGGLHLLLRSNLDLSLSC
jgi:hypothetical protein